MKLIQVSDLRFVLPGTRLLGLDPRAGLGAGVPKFDEVRQGSDRRWDLHDWAPAEFWICPEPH